MILFFTMFSLCLKESVSTSGFTKPELRRESFSINPVFPIFFVTFTLR